MVVTKVLTGRVFCDSIPSPRLGYLYQFHLAYLAGDADAEVGRRDHEAFRRFPKVLDNIWSFHCTEVPEVPEKGLGRERHVA